ncbi:hypothetical protein Tco_0581643 [Tanacetum coccineum]
MGESSITDARYLFDKAGKRVLPPEWSKFVTDVKLVKDLHTSNFDQLHAYLEQHELIANEVRFVVPVFSPGDDLIACLNKAMAFLTAVASSRKELLNATTAKVKDIWLGNALSLSDQGMQRDPGILAGQKKSDILPHNARGGGTEDLDTYDSDCDDLSTAQAVLMANISNYGSDVILEANKEQNNETITAELERYKERVKTFKQRLNIDLSSREKMIDSQMDDMIIEKLALKEQVDSLEQNLSKQIKEKESVLQTFAIFKNKSKEKENKYMENEIDLEKKIKELEIIFV